MLGEIVVGDGNVSGASGDIDQTILPSSKIVVINPDTLGTVDGDAVAVGYAPVTHMGAGGHDLARSSGMQVVDVQAMNDNITNILQGNPGAPCYANRATAAVDGFVAGDHEFQFELDGHVGLENDPQGLGTGGGVAERPGRRVRGVVVAV